MTIVSALIAAAAFLFQQVSVRQEYEWRRLKEAQDILKDWDVRAGPFKFAIEAYYCERHNWSRMQPISREDALALSDRRATPELLQVRTNVVALLNYFELISTAALRRIADEPILRESLATQMVAWRGYLKEFTDLTDREVGEPAWGPYYTIADRWKKDPAAQPQVTAPPKRPSHDWGTMDRR